MNRLTLALWLGLVVVMSACDESPAGPSEIEGHSWFLTSIQRGDTSVAVADPSHYTIRFEENGRVSVRSDCNSCSGSYSLGRPSATIGPLACTRAFCGSASLDTEYTRALETARSIVRTGDTLTIQCDGVVLRFKVQDGNS
jgi:heat shock protein HslJ